ncbi:hypothetical protein Tco_0541708, partial [Tanacetum coccineum]
SKFAYKMKNIEVSHDMGTPKEVVNDEQTKNSGLDVGTSSFASLLKNPNYPTTSKVVRLKVMNNSENFQGENVAIPLAVVNEVSSHFENTLYGYFV